MYSVFFPNLPALWNGDSYKNGFKVTWPMLRDDVEFTELSPGVMQGVLKVVDAAE